MKKINTLKVILISLLTTFSACTDEDDGQQPNIIIINSKILKT